MATQCGTMTEATGPSSPSTSQTMSPARPKLHGRAFYESIGSPKYILAPMVDQSEFAWRMLSRSFLPPSQRSTILAYSPMLHARLFAESDKYRDAHFQPQRPPPPSSKDSKDGKSSKKATSATASSLPPWKPADQEPAWLDGNPQIDRPLFVQFCANDPKALLAAAQMVAPFCDAVDLNLGCPQGIARKGHYGAFLQEDQALIYELINTLHKNLSVPVTAKIRILETKEATLAYARNVLAAGASILTVHGRRREQKGHLTGKADWDYIKFLREELPKETVMFANGNILGHADFESCLKETGVDGVMTAEGNLSDPAIFASVPPTDGSGAKRGEYWMNEDGKGGWRVDAVMRRYLDVLHEHVMGQAPPERRPLFVPGDDEAWLTEPSQDEPHQGAGDEEPARKKRKRDAAANGSGRNDTTGPNLGPVQAHLFHLLRHLVSQHHDIRDALARSKAGSVAIYETLLGKVEKRVAHGLLEYAKAGVVTETTETKHRALNGSHTEVNTTETETPRTTTSVNDATTIKASNEPHDDDDDDPESSARTIREYKRPWWIAQPIIRPLPKEALAKGAIMISKKEQKKMDAVEQEAAANATKAAGSGSFVSVGALEKTTEFGQTGLVSG